MTLDGFFRGIGSFLQWTFNLLQDNVFSEGLGLTFFMNTGIVVIGFVGLFYWLNTQRKFNDQAKNNPNQIK